VLLVACLLLLLFLTAATPQVVFFSAEIFREAGMQNGDLGALLLMLVQLVLTVFACYLVDKAGRKILLIISATGMSIFSATMGLFFYLKVSSSSTCSRRTVLLPEGEQQQY
jgi:SP family facilitated glucose transporter-like MFS transporter 8